MEIQFSDKLDQAFSQPEEIYQQSPEELEAERLEQERQNQIGAARVILAQTDYQILKACEQLLLNQSAKGIATASVQSVSSADNGLADVIALRQEQREIINELE